MYFTNNFLQTILLLGVIQGGILSAILFSSSKMLRINRYLGALILLVSLACLNAYFFHAQWFQQSLLCQILHSFIPLVVFMPVGPLIYFYAKSVTNAGWQLQSKDYRHFYPVIIDLIPYLTALIYAAGYFTKLLNNPGPWASFIDNYNIYSDIPRWISITAYLFGSYRLIKKQGIEKPYYNWLRLFILGFCMFQFIWGCFMIPYIIPQYSNYLLDHVGWYPVMVPLVILIYWAGMKGYLLTKPGISLAIKESRTADKIAPDVADQLLIRLTKAMAEECLYLKTDLDLEMLSRQLNIPPKTISTVLNSYLNQSFSQWLNSYRVNAFKQKITQDNNAHLTLVGIAFECGFNSQASFQRVFKQATGMVPSQYKASLK